MTNNALVLHSGNDANFLFSFKGQDFRAVKKDGVELFVADDICGVLGINNTSDTVGRLDDDEKGIASIYTPGGVQDMLCVTESGLYSLIFTSRKAIAKEFKRWVFHEVLPEIRRSGAYIPRSLTDEQIYRLRQKLSFRGMTNAIQYAYHLTKAPNNVYINVSKAEIKAVLGKAKEIIVKEMGLTPEQADHLRDFVSECALLAFENVEILASAKMRQAEPHTLHTKDLMEIVRDVAAQLVPSFRLVAESMGIDFVSGKPLLKDGQ